MGKIINMGNAEIFVGGKKVGFLESCEVRENEIYVEGTLKSAIDCADLMLSLEDGKTLVPLYDRGKVVGHMDASPLTHELNRLSGVNTGRWSGNGKQMVRGPTVECSHDWESYIGVMSRDWTCKKCGKRVTDDPTGGRE